MTDRLARLAQICDLDYQAKLQHVRPLHLAEVALQEELARLDEMTATRSAEIGQSDSFDPACRASADLHWQKWLAARRRDLMLERTRLRAKIETHKAEIARAFGRKEVARRLVKTSGGRQTS